MNRALLALAGLIALLVAGCATPEPAPSGPPRVLVALQLAGGGVPTPEQIAKVHQAIAPVMAQQKFQLAESLERADYVMTAIFTPDPMDPDGGRLKVQSLEPARRWRGRTGNPEAAQLKAMQDRVDNLERWGQRAEIRR